MRCELKKTGETWLLSSEERDRSKVKSTITARVLWGGGGRGGWPSGEGGDWNESPMCHR